MSAIPQAPLLRPGLEPLPGYRLRLLLGRGSFGEVWEAEALSDRSVALKFLPCDHSAAASEENRSIQMVRHLEHPNLIQIDNVWCYPGYLVVSMELADGTLQDLFEAYRAKCATAIIPEHLCSLLVQAAAALDFLNTRQHHLGDQVVALHHCDIKPSNLLLFGPTLKLTDFSLTSATTLVMKIHRQGGTPDYSAPEVFQGRLSDRTDQYALAVTYCQMRTGRLPFEPAPRPYSRTYVRPLPDLSQLPEAEQPIIARALARAPCDRWPCCTEMIEQLCKEIERSPRAVPLECSGGVRPNAALPSGQPERRAAPRHQCSLRVVGRLLSKPPGPPWPATFRDVSRVGVGLLSGQYCARGSVLDVTLEAAAERFARPLLVTVVRTSKLPNGCWLLGCTFNSALSDADLQMILRSAGRSPA
jgi:serine/threonine protein kinase